MKILFRSNLDDVLSDVHALNATWPQGVVPRKGERIAFRFDGGKEYELEVCAVSYQFDTAHRQLGAVRVELHVPSYYGSMSLAEWMTWFAKHRLGRTR